MPALVPIFLALALGEQAPAPAAAPPAPPPPAADANAASPPATGRYQIELIRFDGLRRVRESEVRRHVLVSEGEILDEERVLLSRLKLLQLGWFSRVETRIER